MQGLDGFGVNDLRTIERHFNHLAVADGINFHGVGKQLGISILQAIHILPDGYGIHVQHSRQYSRSIVAALAPQCHRFAIIGSSDKTLNYHNLALVQLGHDRLTRFLCRKIPVNHSIPVGSIRADHFTDIQPFVRHIILLQIKGEHGRRKQFTHAHNLIVRVIIKCRVGIIDGLLQLGEMIAQGYRSLGIISLLQQSSGIFQVLLFQSVGCRQRFLLLSFSSQVHNHFQCIGGLAQC